MQHKFKLLLDSPHEIFYYGCGLWCAFIGARWHGVPSTLLQSQKCQNLSHWSPVTTTCRKCSVDKDLERFHCGWNQMIPGEAACLLHQALAEKLGDQGPMRNGSLISLGRFSPQGKAPLDSIFSGFSCTSGKMKAKMCRFIFYLHWRSQLKPETTP